MHTITRNELIPVLRDMVAKHPGVAEPYMWDGHGRGVCFVGMLLDTLGISPRQADLGEADVALLVRGAASSFMPVHGISEAALDRYAYKIPGKPLFTFDPELIDDINRSITLNDSGEPWSFILAEIWGIEVQPDPLPPIKPIKIVTDPPVTKKPSTNYYGDYFTPKGDYFTPKQLVEMNSFQFQQLATV